MRIHSCRCDTSASSTSLLANTEDVFFLLKKYFWAVELTGAPSQTSTTPYHTILHNALVGIAGVRITLVLCVCNCCPSTSSLAHLYSHLM